MGLEQADERRYLAALVDQIEPLLDVVGHAVARIRLHPRGLFQQTGSQRLQLGGQGGGEEHLLPRVRHRLHQPLDIGPEPHLQQAVRLVQHQSAQAGQGQQLLAQQIPQPPRGRHQQLRPQRQLGLLLRLFHPAAQGHQPQTQPGGRPLQRLAHLHRQLAGRHQHQPLHLCQGGIQPLQQRQAERQGLAAAGAGQRQQIPSRQRGRDGQLLYPGRVLKIGWQGRQQGGGKGELVKGHGTVRISKWEGEV